MADTHAQPPPPDDGWGFGARMKRAREEEGLTQRDLVEQLREHGVKLDSSAITRMESGSREPRLREAIAIAEILGFTLSTADIFDVDDGERQFATSEELMKREMIRARRRIIGACLELHVAFDGLFSGTSELHVLQRRGVTTPLEWARQVSDQMVQRFSVEDESGGNNYVHVTDPVHREMLEIIVNAVTANLYKTDAEIFEMSAEEKELIRLDAVRRAQESLLEVYGAEEFDKRFAAAFDATEQAWNSVRSIVGDLP